MKKAEFIAHIAENYKCSNAEAKKAIEMVTESITGVLAQGDSVSFIGFGSFAVKQRPAREGRNPKTGEPLNIAAYNQPGFKAGSDIKKACNGEIVESKNRSKDNLNPQNSKNEKNGKQPTNLKVASKKK